MEDAEDAEDGDVGQVPTGDVGIWQPLSAIMFIDYLCISIRSHSTGKLLYDQPIRRGDENGTTLNSEAYNVICNLK